MATMGQSFNLPSGMMESLADYKAALKGAKAELRELEQDARRAAKSGTLTPAQAQNLNTARNRRNSLEDLVAQQKAMKRSSAPGGGGEAEEERRSSGVSLSELFTFRGAMKAAGFQATEILSGSMKKRYKALQSLQEQASQRIGTVDEFLLGGRARDLQGVFIGSGYNQYVKLKAAKLKAARDASKLYRRLELLSAIKSGRIVREIMQMEVPKLALRGGAAPTVGGLVAAPAIGLTVGFAVKAAMERMGESGGILNNLFGMIGREEGASRASTETAIFNFERSISDAGTGDPISRGMINTARMAGEAANRKRYAERTPAGKLWEIILGRSSEAIKYQDQMIENSLKRQTDVNRYGGQLTKLTNDAYIRSNQRLRVSEEMRKDLNFVNYGISKYFQYVGLMKSTDFYDFTSWAMLGNDVEDAEQKAFERIKNSNIEKYHKQIEEEKREWSNKANTNYAIQRCDAHNRQRAITAFETDRLTRGLTWQR